MPEAGEVEVVRRSLESLVGETLTGIQAVDPALAGIADPLIGAELSAVRRVGKRLALDFGDTTLVIHLRMTGALTLDEDFQTACPTLRADLAFGPRRLWFTDLRRLGSWCVAEPEAVAEGLGVDLLDATDSEFVAAAQLCATRSRAAKALMLDQSGPIAGAGNYLVDESLFLAYVYPGTPANDLTAERWRDIWEHCRSIARRALEGRVYPLADYVAPADASGLQTDRLACYGRRGQPCVLCGTTMSFVLVAARGSTYCPTCQPRIGSPNITK